jgi:hypothetical protein
MIVEKEIKLYMCSLIWNLSINDKNREIIGRAGGVEYLINIIENINNNVENEKLFEAALGALINLSIVSFLFFFLCNLIIFMNYKGKNAKRGYKLEAVQLCISIITSIFSSKNFIKTFVGKHSLLLSVFFS